MQRSRSEPSQHHLLRLPRDRSRLPRPKCHFQAAPGTVVNRTRRWDRDDRVPIGIRRALGEVAIPNLLVASWRWRWEIALLTGVTAVLTAGIISVGVLPTIALVTVIALTVMGLPPTRQLVLNCAWCTITAHRVRVGCAEAMIYSSRGKIPVILRTTHQPFGERALLWCRAGTSVDDFITNLAILTSACWAQDITVLHDMRRPHLVTLDVVRRPPYGIPSDHGSNRATNPPNWSPWPRGGDV